MALETLKGIELINEDKVIVMDDLKNSHPHLFNDSGSMDYKVFETEIRPKYPIQIRYDKNSISFTLQNGPIKENGKNGCQLTALIEAAKIVLERLNNKFPCRENSITITKLEEALMWQEKRTKDRLTRGVEGKNLA